MSNPLIVVIGPTAAGKTKLAVALAAQFNGEVISADSRQVFRDMDIGTGKDLHEYQFGDQQIPYHLINIKAAGEKYQVNAFKEDFYEAYQTIRRLHKLPILCGGTGMYIHSILQNHELTAIPVNDDLRLQLQVLTKEELRDKLNTYPEELRQQADYSSAKRLIRATEIAAYLTHNSLKKIERPEIEPLIIGLDTDVATRRRKIIERLDHRLKNGLIEEVHNLMANGISAEMLTFYGLEYKFIAAYLANEMDFTTLSERLGIAICQFAKRQMTFFRKMEKDGVKINWLLADDLDLKEKAIQLIAHKFDLK